MSLLCNEFSNLLAESVLFCSGPVCGFKLLYCDASYLVAAGPVSKTDADNLGQ